MQMKMKKEISINKVKKDAEDLFRGGFFILFFLSWQFTLCFILLFILRFSHTEMDTKVVKKPQTGEGGRRGSKEGHNAYFD